MNNHNSSIHYKYALITGASSGIGYEFSKILAMQKHNLILIGRAEDALRTIKEKFKNEYLVEVRILVLDLSDLEKISVLKKYIDDENIDIDILINCAGFGMYGFFSENDWQKELSMINVNIVALSYITKIVLNKMIKQRTGKILNVASTASFKPGPLMAVYFATKSYVLSFSEAIAAEVKGFGITVTTLCPGATRSNFQKVALIDDSQHFKFKRMMSSDEVARIGIDAMKNGKNVVIPGLMNKVFTLILRFLPYFIITNVMMKIKKKKK
jgi:short-subunit dehydrogenase